MSFPEEKSLPENKPEPIDQPDSLRGAADEPIPPFPVSDADVDIDFENMPDDLATFRRRLQEIDFQPEPFQADEFAARPATAARRRHRSNRLIERPDTGQLGEKLESIARRASPTIDFFIFAFLSGCILSVGFILNAPAILLLGIAAAPLLAPWIGLMIATAVGETRFLSQTFGAFATVILAIFVLGLLGGFASRLFQPMDSTQALLHARLWWPDLLLLALGTAILMVAFIQSEDKPILASLLVAYEFFLPVSAAGFGIGSGVQGLWPQAGLVFFIHLAVALIISLAVIFYMGFRPLDSLGYVFASLAVITSIALVAGFLFLGTRLQLPSQQAVTETPSATASALPTNTVTATLTISASQTPTVKVVTQTPTPDPLFTATNTRAVKPTLPVTFTPEGGIRPTNLPTPIYGKVESSAGGVTIRVKPDGFGITTILNGYLAEFLPEDPITLNGEVWVKVLIRTPGQNIEGWVLRNLIITATPSGAP